MDKVTKKTPPSKPDKPYDGFPLYAHATGRWAKKIRGRLHYFGPWADPDAALSKFLNERDDLFAGRRPYAVSDRLTIRELANRFLTAKQHRVDSGELSPRTFHDYYKTCQQVVDAFGRTRPVERLSALDFEVLRASIARTRRAVALGNEVQRVRGLFKYADEAEQPDQSGVCKSACCARDMAARFELLRTAPHVRNDRWRVARPSGRGFHHGSCSR